MTIHSKGELPGDIENIASTIKSELDRSSKVVTNLDLPTLNRITIHMQDGSLLMMRVGDLDIVAWVSEGADHEAILIDSMAKLNSTPVTNIADDDGSILEEGLKTLERKGGLDNLLSMLSRGNSESISGYIRVEENEDVLDLLISKGIPVGARSIKSLSMKDIAYNSTAPKAKLTLYSLPKIERLKEHLNTTINFTINSFCDNIAKSRTRSKDREKQINKRLM